MRLPSCEINAKVILKGKATDELGMINTGKAHFTIGRGVNGNQIDD